jgi:hypothetical protein
MSDIEDEDNNEFRQLKELEDVKHLTKHIKANRE